jgi:hypothetical protein
MSAPDLGCMELAFWSGREFTREMRPGTTLGGRRWWCKEKGSGLSQPPHLGIPVWGFNCTLYIQAIDTYFETTQNFNRPDCSRFDVLKQPLNWFLSEHIPVLDQNCAPGPFDIPTNF